jgi:hydrogenase expression/formation protein HypD
MKRPMVGINEVWFRERKPVLNVARRLGEITTRPIRLMEVCGGHTMAVHRFGLKNLIPPNIQLLSGPGCPVCVSSHEFLDTAIALSRQPDVIITTYGDLIRVPASHASLEQERCKGADIRMVYSTMEALDLAKRHPEKKIIFLGIGFETTAPLSAYAIKQAREEKIDNFLLYSAHKLMPPALELLSDGPLHIDGFIAPGHVSSITGTGIYNFLAEKYGKAVVVSGFEALDIMWTLQMLVQQVVSDEPKVENEYSRVVKPEGNVKALAVMNEVFQPANAVWRGLGTIPLSGLELRSEFANHDALNHFDVQIPASVKPAGCICGEILKGMKTPGDCPLFAKVCTPENPVGACMVSMEGSCAIHFKYIKH